MMTMTDKQKAHVQILANQFIAKNKDTNPHTRSAAVFDWWYSKHSKSEPIPKEMLPGPEYFEAWDVAMAQYIAEHLEEYSTLLAFWEETQGKPKEAIGEVVARRRPCECREAQCSIFCCEYGKENCYGKKDL